MGDLGGASCPWHPAAWRGGAPGRWDCWAELTLTAEDASHQRLRCLLLGWLRG
jgi:hypothetical protein